jgi:hypothetical protein
LKSLATRTVTKPWLRGLDEHRYATNRNAAVFTKRADERALPKKGRIIADLETRPFRKPTSNVTRNRAHLVERGFFHEEDVLSGIIQATSARNSLCLQVRK